jgi:hypothetical protein
MRTDRTVAKKPIIDATNHAPISAQDSHSWPSAHATGGEV